MTTANNIYHQGQKAFLSGDMEGSIHFFSDALDNGVHPTHSRLNRGIARFKIGQFSHAVEDFNAIIAVDEDHQQALFYRGVTFLNLGETKKAVQDLDRLLELNPLKSGAYLARGFAHLILGNLSAADHDIHNKHVLNGVELGEFLEDNIISESLFQYIVKFFENDDARWALRLTESEVHRMESIH